MTVLLLAPLTSPNMTYNVFGGTLLYLLIYLTVLNSTGENLRHLIQEWLVTYEKPGYLA